MQTAIAKKKRHSRVEIATKLAQATDLATQGRSQREIAHMLGVSVMTLHRWRKVPPGPQTTFVALQINTSCGVLRGAQVRNVTPVFAVYAGQRLVTLCEEILVGIAQRYQPTGCWGLGVHKYRSNRREQVRNLQLVRLQMRMPCSESVVSALGNQEAVREASSRSSSL